MYQNPVARLRLTEGVGSYLPTLLRTGEPGMTEVVALLGRPMQWAAILINDASAGYSDTQPTNSREGGNS